MRYMKDVFEEHLDEATWLWGRWEQALLAPDHDLSELAELEVRLLAHLEGLAEGGEEVAEALLHPGLDSEEDWRASAVAYALLVKAVPEGVLALVRGASLAQRPAVRRALELCNQSRLGNVLQPLLSSDDLDVTATALEVLVARNDIEDSRLVPFLTSDDSRVRIAAMKGIRNLSDSTPRKALTHALVSAHPDIRDAAIEWGLAMGVRDAWAACQKAVEKGDDHAREPMILWALGSEETELALLLSLLHVPERRMEALWALGFSGRLAAADACLEWMEDSNLKVARLAGEAFCAISGLRLEGTYVALPKEALEEPIPLNQEDLDADLVPRPEDELPVPDVEAVARWWHATRANLDGRTRYLRGHPFQAGVLLAALEQGPLRRRHVLARALDLRTRRRLFVPTRAWTRIQYTALTQAKAAALPLGRLEWR